MLNPEVSLYSLYSKMIWLKTVKMPLIDHIREFLYCSDCNLNADFFNIVKLLSKFNARDAYLRSKPTAVAQML